MNQENPVAYNTEVTLTYTPKTGYESHEATWSVNESPILGNKFTMPDEDVTITVSVDLIQWVETSLANLTSADAFVIVCNASNNKHYAMSNDKGTSAAPEAVEVSLSGDKLIGVIPEKLQWNLIENASGYIFYPKGVTNKWLYNIGSDTKCKVGTGDNNTYVFDDTYNYLINTGTNRYIGVYNNNDWRGYPLDGSSIHSNISNETFAFYKKVTEDISISTTISAYDDNTNGWNLIASPVASVTPSVGNGFLTHTHDLYRFDQTGGDNDKPWRNYYQNEFKLVSGTGYLYANSEGTELTFTGQPYNGNGVVGLTYVTSLEDELLKGLNLVGNPFNSTATINKAFYRINNEHNGFTAEVAANSPVNPMEGVFVYATAVNQTVTFTPAAQNSNAPSNNVAMVAMNLVQNRSNVIDRAIVCFDSEDVLPKFQLFENSTKLYIKKDGKDYAIVGSKDQGEMPVNFVAAEDGQYTITVNTENIEMGYLHLIDNIAGKDIDLLATPSYTFSAKADDYESRFRLVFSTTMVNAEMGEDFAFISDGQLVIANVGEAILQVIDVTGRVVAIENINGTCSKAINAKAGVYVLRLINGTDVKTQKMVIR